VNTSGDYVGTYVIGSVDEVMSRLPPRSPGVLQLHGVKTGICSILYHRDKPFGMIGVFDEHEHPWLEEDVQFLTNCAQSLSVLIERTQHSLEIAHERQRVDELLCTILPLPISQRLKTSEAPIADAHSSVTILFADIVNFTQVSSLVTPKELVSFLNKVFSAFDIETLTRGLEKIKIIGDCYMVAGGLFSHENDHAEAVVDLACDILIALDQLLKEEYPDHPHFANISVRVGINTGPVVAGVIGLDRFLYDVWGDAVNTASRLEATGLPGHIHISEATMRSIVNKERFEFEPRGSIYLKGKGEMQTLFVRRKETR
jgi:class 3 adenylate cyclase